MPLAWSGAMRAYRFQHIIEDVPSSNRWLQESWLRHSRPVLREVSTPSRFFERSGTLRVTQCARSL
jgi:hypothetical protein